MMATLIEPEPGEQADRFGTGVVTSVPAAEEDVDAGAAVLCSSWSPSATVADEAAAISTII
jgi:hypothetical protein